MTKASQPTHQRAMERITSSQEESRARVYMDVYDTKAASLVCRVSLYSNEGSMVCMEARSM